MEIVYILPLALTTIRASNAASIVSNNSYLSEGELGAQDVLPSDIPADGFTIVLQFCFTKCCIHYEKMRKRR